MCREFHEEGHCRGGGSGVAAGRVGWVLDEGGGMGSACECVGAPGGDEECDARRGVEGDVDGGGGGVEGGKMRRGVINSV